MSFDDDCIMIPKICYRLTFKVVRWLFLYIRKVRRVLPIDTVVLAFGLIVPSQHKTLSFREPKLSSEYNLDNPSTTTNLSTNSSVISRYSLQQIGHLFNTKDRLQPAEHSLSWPRRGREPQANKSRSRIPHQKQYYERLFWIFHQVIIDSPERSPYLHVVLVTDHCGDRNTQYYLQASVRQTRTTS